MVYTQIFQCCKGYVNSICMYSQMLAQTFSYHNHELASVWGIQTWIYTLRNGLVLTGRYGYYHYTHIYAILDQRRRRWADVV